MKNFMKASAPGKCVLWFRLPSINVKIVKSFKGVFASLRTEFLPLRTILVTAYFWSQALPIHKSCTNSSNSRQILGLFGSFLAFLKLKRHIFIKSMLGSFRKHSIIGQCKILLVIRVKIMLKIRRQSIPCGVKVQ